MCVPVVWFTTAARCGGTTLAQCGANLEEVGPTLGQHNTGLVWGQPRGGGPHTGPVLYRRVVTLSSWILSRFVAYEHTAPSTRPEIYMSSRCLQGAILHQELSPLLCRNRLIVYTQWITGNVSPALVFVIYLFLLIVVFLICEVPCCQIELNWVQNI